MFFHKLLLFLHRRVRINEYYPLLSQVFPQIMIYYLGLVLRTNASKEFPFCLWDTKFFKRIPYGVWDVIPTLALLFRSLRIIVTFLQINFRQVTAPVSDWFAHEHIIRPESEVPHPVRFTLQPANLFDGAPGQ